jgi:hypothetical protein
MDAGQFFAEAAEIEGLLKVLTRDREVDVRINAQGALTALAGIAAVGGSAGGATTRLSAAFGGLGASAAASAPLIIAFGTAIALLIGVAGAAAGALGGLALALGAPLGAAGAGGGLFALLAGKYISETNKVIDQVKKLKEEGKTGEANALIANLTTAQKGYMKAREGFSAAFKSFTEKNGAALLTPIQFGLEKLTKVLRGNGLAALITAVSGSLNKFLLNLDTKGINNLLLSMSKLAGPVIDSVLSSLSSFGSIMGSIFGAGKDLGVKALDGMSNALGRLDGYLKSKEGRAQLNEFFTWVETHGPGILQNFIDIGEGIFKFVKALTPAGEAFLTFLGFFGKLGFLAPVFKVAMAVVIAGFTALTMIIGAVTGVLGTLFTLIGKIPGTPDWVDGIGKGLTGVSKNAQDATKKMTDLILETDKAGKKNVKIPVSANTAQAKKDADAVARGITKLNPFIPVNADTKPAETTTSSWAAGWHNRTIYIKIGATISAAAQKVMSFLGKFGTSAKFSLFGASGGRIPAGYAGGGIVPGTTPSNRSFDNVAAISRRGNPLRVQSGEWIINSAASRQNDRLLAAINGGFNAQRALGFSMGGPVPARPKGYASGGRITETSTVNNAPVFNISTTGPLGPTLIQEVNWWGQFGPQTNLVGV